MKKISTLILVGFFSLILSPSLAQFDKGDKLLDLGLGVNSVGYSGGFPLHAAFEVGINDVLSIGAGVDFLTHNYKISSTRYGYSVFYPGFRVSYHFNKLFNLNIEELDIYGGGSLGFRVFAWNDGTPPPGYNSFYQSGVFATAHVGARWYFKPSFGVFAEVGAGGSSNVKGGIVFKF